MNPIIDLALDSLEFDGNTHSITFSFTKPTGNIGGYEVYKSYDNVTFTSLGVKIDSIHGRAIEESTIDSNGKTYLTITNEDFGCILFIQIKSIDTTYTYSLPSNIITVEMYPSKVENCFATYDAFGVTISWNPIEITSTKNAAITGYNLRRYVTDQIQEIEFDEETNTITHTSLESGQLIVVTDFMKRSCWFGEINTSGEFTLSNDNIIIKASDNADDYTIIKDNLKCYIVQESGILLTNTTDTTYVDTTILQNVYYMYIVTAEGISLEGLPGYYPIFTIGMEYSYPYLRSVGNSSTGFIRQESWRLMKNVLTDNKYYNKESYAIPYAEDTEINFKGYLGVSDCKLDIFINDIYSYTTSTGDYGEFDINYDFPRGDLYMSFQARDKFNIGFSRKSIKYKITSLNIYSLFSAEGNEYEEIKNKIIEVIDDGLIETATPTAFDERFAPFIELYRHADEESTRFRKIASEIFKMFEFVSYDESLNMLMDVFVNNTKEADHYEVYYTNDLYNTHSSGRAYILTSSGLARDIYYYGISVENNINEETSVSSIIVDNRWWPTNYAGMNVLHWDEVPEAIKYNIYRGNSLNTLEYLVSTRTNIFADIGLFTTSTGYSPKPYNLTDMSTPNNLYVDNSIYVTKLIERLKKPSGIIIILYSKGDEDIPDITLTRIRQLLQKIIPPEIKYQLIYAKDSESQFLEVNLDG